MIKETVNDFIDILILLSPYIVIIFSTVAVFILLVLLQWI